LFEMIDPFFELHAINLTQ
jgi:hypothetical protein